MTRRVFFAVVAMGSGLVGWLACRAGEARVRLGFLHDPAVWGNTAKQLQEAGCGLEAIGILDQALARYRASPFDFNGISLPEPRAGTYRFSSMAQLVSALPHPLSETAHPFELNCFDAVILLSGDQMSVSAGINKRIGPFPVSSTGSNGMFRIDRVLTASEAFAVGYPSWYREATDRFLAPGKNEMRIGLTAALSRFHELEGGAEEPARSQLPRVVLEVLRADWRRHGLRFPGRFDLVLCHEVSRTSRWIATAHAGVLLRTGAGFTYLEKAGGAGPFTRLDFEKRDDLRLWLARMFRGAERLGYTDHFVTFDDREIERLDVGKSGEK